MLIISAVIVVVKMSDRSLNFLPRITALLLVLSAFTGIFFIYSNWNYEGRFWQNWYPLLINHSQLSPELELEIHRLSGNSAVSQSNSFLEYSDYKELESLSLKDFLEGKGPYKEDPRIDPYMTGISSYFNQNIYEIFYLPSDQSPLEYQRLFSASSLLKEVDWILPDWNSGKVQVLLYTAVMLLLCFGALRFCITAGSFAAAGFLVYAQGQSSVLLVLAVTALFLRLLVKQYHRFSWYSFLPFMPTAAAYYMGMLQFQHLQLTGLLILVFAGAALWPRHQTGRPSIISGGKRSRGRISGILVSGTVKSKRGLRHQDHPLFEPVSLFAKPGHINMPSAGRPSFFLLSAAVLCLVLCVLNLPGEKRLPAAVPSAETSEGFWDYEGLVQTENSGALPGAAEYMKHRAYQESFIYGGIYSLPVPGSIISYDDYHFSEGRVYETNPSVLLFSESWYESRLVQMADSGPGKLLASETSPPFISARSTMTVGISLQLLFAFAVLIIVFVLIQISGSHHAIENSGIRSYGKFILRRKQQAA